MNTTREVATIHEILTGRPGTVLQTIEHNQPLTIALREGVVGLEFEAGPFSVADWPDQERRVLTSGVAESVTLTGDGRRYDRQGWHVGDESGEWVRVERWTAAGLEFHGFIHPITRKLVQAG